ncbi:hypothetical protein [Xanthobacter autotrophicus]|uniref:hypothetical protein n=1 Tax=Xanthobacter autotrophicus TaxID=280 RepID=UPI003727B117
MQSRLLRPRFLHLRYFGWIVVAVAAFYAWQAFGLPHMLWSYSYLGARTSWAARRDTSCTYLGPYGPFTAPPAGERCALVVFARPHGRVQ